MLMRIIAHHEHSEDWHTFAVEAMSDLPYENVTGEPGIQPMRPEDVETIYLTAHVRSTGRSLTVEREVRVLNINPETGRLRLTHRLSSNGKTAHISARERREVKDFLEAQMSAYLKGGDAGQE
jgi:hypothetical protein